MSTLIREAKLYNKYTGIKKRYIDEKVNYLLIKTLHISVYLMLRLSYKMSEAT